MDHKELIKEIDNRLQLALVIAIFFPGLLSTFSTFIGDAVSKTSNIVLSWSALIAVYLLAYVFFKASGKIIPKPVLKWLNRILLLGIGFFVVPITVFTCSNGMSSHWIAWLYTRLFVISIWGLPLIATVIFLLIIFGATLGMFRKDSLSKMK
jgi:hypothetical protein